MNQAFLDYYRCPESFADFRSINDNSKPDCESVGYFRIGPDVICYGTALAKSSPKVTDSMPDLLPEIQVQGTRCCLPFDPTEIADNLRYERYVNGVEKARWKRIVRDAYYHVRPALPVSVRRHLQRAWLSRRNRDSFPSWPVDRTVDRMFESLMVTSANAHKNVEIPFIWFWPEGKSSAAIVTHDVETQAGLEFVNELMEINDSFGVKSSFQIIPEERYVASESTLSAIRSRGFEINVHDLKHDGHLFDDHQEFLKSAGKINQYAERFGSKGFRAGVLYRNQSWFSAFSFSYDMSVPNSAHFDPQPGGCCTVMPYFVGDILELPVTTIQDYSLFNIIGTYSLDLWREQIAQISGHHGLASFIVHPDYLNSKSARAAYAGLLRHLDTMRSNQGLWIALPAQVDEWWRQRSKMRLVQHDGHWKIEGAGSERATVAYAVVADDRLKYRIN
jgi:hypothetical protein